MADYRLDGRNPLAYMGVRPTTPPKMLVMERPPTAKDVQNFVLGTQWLYVNQSNIQDSIQYVLVDAEQNTATWLPLNEAGVFSAPDHSVLLGTGTTTIGSVGPETVSGLPLVSQGLTSDPIFGVAAVLGGGTGQFDLDQYSVLLGNGTDSVQFADTIATQGAPLISNGSGFFPSFGVASVSGGGTGLDEIAPYAVVCGGLTSEGPLQVASGIPSSGLVLTANGTGVLPSWQSGGSGGGGGGPIAIQVFTTSGTYTPTGGMARCIVELVGGGAGGTSVDTTSSHPIGGDGGGGAAYTRKLFTATDIGASKAIVIGTGGAADTDGVDSTFGSTLLTAGKGLTSATPGIPGIGGTATSGDINIRGGNGGVASEDNSGIAFSGFGGSSFYGTGGIALNDGSDSNGSVGLSYGSGGSGALANDAAQTKAGGAGASGLCVVTEFGPFATPPPSNDISINTIYFTTPGADTYTPTAGMFQCMVECLGAGGGGAGSIPGTGGVLIVQGGTGSGGGGAGGYSKKLFDSATIGASQSLVIGAGGTAGPSSAPCTAGNGGNTTFGAFITASGGSGGVGAANSMILPAAKFNGGVGGMASGGDLNITGQTGGVGFSTAFSQTGGSGTVLVQTINGCGGNSMYGQGAANAFTSGIGDNGTGYGSGGGGGIGSGATSYAGGIGTSGLIIITEYIAS